jgi:hypothetical protein
LFTESDTTGEKDFEEFFTANEVLDMSRFENLGIIKNELNVESDRIIHFENTIQELRNRGDWTKQEIVDLFHYMISDFGHKETGKYLDAKM